MFYIGRCHRCGFIVSNADCQLFKSLMAQHMNQSHGQDYCFVHAIPLMDFEDFTIIRIRDSDTFGIPLETIFGNKGFWVAIRTHPDVGDLVMLRS